MATGSPERAWARARVQPHICGVDPEQPRGSMVSMSADTFQSQSWRM